MAEDIYRILNGDEHMRVQISFIKAQVKMICKNVNEHHCYYQFNLFLFF